MADLVCQMGLGRAAYYLSLPAANDALVYVLLKKTNLEADDALRDYASLSTLLAGTTDECNATNYVRKVFTTGTTITYNAASNRVDCFVPSATWTSLGTSVELQQVQKLLIGYWPTNGTGGDAAIQPVTIHDRFRVCDGNDFQVTLSAGAYRDAG